MQLLLIAALLAASADSLPVIRPRRLVNEAGPRIDGVLEPLWNTTDSTKSLVHVFKREVLSDSGWLWITTDSTRGFVQRYPDEGKPATDSTVVFVMYDAANLYVAFKCYARPDQLTLMVAARDNRQGDNVGLLLDTFDDNSSAYYFCVNAKGVQYDSRIFGDAGTWDNSWDGVWFSDARVTDYGYCAEMRIPFKSIRYKPGLETWGVNFDRYVPRNDEQSDWTLQKHGMLKVSNAGRLEGIQPNSRGLNLEIYPVGLVRYDATADRRFEPNGGLDLSWYPGSATSIQATVNPDFAQIEADPTQITLGRYEIWLEERRPFFVEGSDVFQLLSGSGTGIFYSRRIGKPLPGGGAAPILAGLKGMTKFERFELGGMGAVCRETTFAEYDTMLVPHDTFPGYDTLWVPHDTDLTSSYMSFRARRDFLKNSSVGLLYAGKENRLMSNRALGTDLSLLLGDFSVSGDVAFARYQKDTIVNQAPAGLLSLNWQGKDAYAWASYTNVPHRFDVRGIGYEPMKYESFILTGGKTFRNLGILRTITPRFGLNGSHDNDDLQHHYFTTAENAGASFGFTNNWNLFFSGGPRQCYNYVLDPDASPPVDSIAHYSSYSGSVSFYSDYAKPLTLSTYCSVVGRSYNYRRHYFAPYLATGASPGWRITPNFSLGLSADNTIELDTLNRVEQQNWIVSPWVSYALTRDLQFNLNGEFVPADTTGRLTLLVSWNLRPKSWLYFVWTERDAVTTSWEGDAWGGTWGDGSRLIRSRPPQRLRTLRLLDRVGVLKLRYLFYF